MNLNPNHLHHAYICRGSQTVWKQELRDFFDTKMSEMTWIDYQYEKLGIDEVRELREILSEKTTGRFIVIDAERFTPDAQNAFLKLLEEPAENTHIFILIPPQVFILETVQSRTIELMQTGAVQNTISPIKEFLFSSIGTRLDKIENLIKERGKDETLQSYEVHQFLDQLESGLYSVFSKKHSLQYAEYFEVIRDARGWAMQTGFPMKNIVEYVAMVLPEFGKK